MANLKGLAVVPRGIEDVAAREIEELLKAKATIFDMAVRFEVKSLLELCRFCYLTQSAARVLFLLASFDISRDFEEAKGIIEQELEGISFKEWVSDETKFKVECRREGEHDFTSQAMAEWLAERIGDDILKERGLEPSADLKEPNLIIYALIVGNTLHLGIDLAGFDISKRDYKVNSHMPSIKGNIGYALLRIAGFEKRMGLVDMSSFSGVVPIEAAFYATDKPINYFRKRELHFTGFPNLKDVDFEKFFSDIDGKIRDKAEGEIFCIADHLRFISAAKANSKIAGVNKSITFSRFDVEWIDTKFGKGSVEVMASNGPRVSKQNEGFIGKYYNELLYQANYILKKGGRIGILTNSLDAAKAAAEKSKLKLAHERSVWQGDEELKIGVFEKA
jgi:23S rRNA G2445 N2-methylase RlmL